MIKEELAEVRDGLRHATPGQLTHDTGEMSTEDLIDDKELVVVMTGAGYVKTVDADAFRASAARGQGVAGTRLREDDLVSHLIYTTAHAYLLFFSNRGKVYRLRAHEIPERERAAKGLPIVNLLPLAPDEHIQAIIDTREFGTERFLFFATKKGVVKKTTFHEYDSSRRDGLIAINLRDGDELVRVIVTDGTDDIFMVGGSGMTIRFAEDDVRAMGRAASGVRGMKLRVDDEVVSVDVARDDDQHPDGHRVGLRQAHAARPVQPPGPRRAGRDRHQAHRPQGPRGRRPSWSASRTRSWSSPRVAPPCARRCATSPRRGATPPACG